jgi:hypothetical protein
MTMRSLKGETKVPGKEEEENFKFHISTHFVLGYDAEGYLPQFL